MKKLIHISWFALGIIKSWDLLFPADPTEGGREGKTDFLSVLFKTLLVGLIFYHGCNQFFPKTLNLFLYGESFVSDPYKIQCCDH